MNPSALFFLVTLVVSVSSQQSCHDHDCTCTDVAGGVCTTPGAASAIHVGTLEECIENCDLFGPFGMCDWLMWYPPELNPNVDENCRLIINTVESMESYLSTCRYLGQPLFYKPALNVDGILDGECMPNGLEGIGTGTCSPACKGAGGACHDCSGTNCAGIAQAECTFVDDPTGESEPLTSYFLCHASCSLKAQQGNPGDYNNFAFLKYDKESQQCTCEHEGNFQCKVQIVKFGISGDGMNKCAIVEDPTECSSDADCPDPSKPKCDQGSGECVQCLSDSDCPNPADDPTEGLCDIGPNICTDGCREDADCDAQDYCKKESDNDEIGSCTLGCRNPGTPCGSGGTCSGNHLCEVGGSVYMKSIEVHTASCVGCNTKELGGANIFVKAIIPSTGHEGSCSTRILDVPDRDDYPNGGGNVVFDKPETLDACYLFHSENDVTEFSVTWTGPGTWVPDTFIIDWNDNTPRCCVNLDSTSLTDGSAASFACDRC